MWKNKINNILRGEIYILNTQILEFESEGGRFKEMSYNKGYTVHS